MRAQAILCDEADGTARWHRFRLSALDHPNVTGQGPQVKGAVNREMIEEWVRDWCEPVANPDDVLPTDVEWLPDSEKWHRPGPIFQARALGLWPDLGSGVLSPAVWEACLGAVPLFDLRRLPELGCDCAQGKGDDYHAIHGRWGAVSVAHKSANTMDPARIFRRLKNACAEMAALANRHRDRALKPVEPRDILTKLDDDGTGNAVGSFLRQEGYNVVCIGAGTAANDPQRYGRRRDELWFRAAELARKGLVKVGLLDRASRARLRQQLLAPEWALDAAGRRVVERKDETKEKIGRSPDDADALLLAYLEGVAFLGGARIPNSTPGRHPGDGKVSHQERRRLFGRR
jgi:hypothetical protein